MTGRKARALTDEDRALWQAVAAGILPLIGRATRRQSDSSPKAETKTVSRPSSQFRPLASVTAPGEPDRKTKRALRRGRLTIERKIDLHGLTQAEAHRVLRNAIEAGRERRLLVVTGRGNAKAEGGVLRRNVPRWLAEPDLARHVVSVGRAAPDHGGDGAFYVLLRRKRA
jgi:DNA-nicking Smr family endonuclease